MKAVVSGASDDLIEVEGDLREEYYAHDDGHGDNLFFSDGTVLNVVYSLVGTWLIQRVQAGKGRLSIEFAPEDDEEVYSDVATLTWDSPLTVYCEPAKDRLLPAVTQGQE